MPPRVSIIIPAYNGDRYLAETINSALQQTYTDFEIVVVDDGSQDNTRHCVQQFGQRVRYEYQTNQGVAAARNRGFQLAAGELVAFLDQDDVLLPNKLALQVAAFDDPLDGTEIFPGIVHSGWRLVDAEGKPWSDIEPWYDAPQLNLQEWLVRMPVLLSAMMFRRSWLERVGSFDSSYKQVNDVDLVQRLVLMGCPAVWVRQVTVLYRQHDRNDSLNTLLQAEESWRVRDRFFSQPNLPPEVRQVERESCYYALVWSAWRLYHRGHLPEMAIYLERAFHFRPGAWTEAVLRWVELFQQYEREYGGQGDTDALTRSPVWQQLMKKLMMMQSSAF
jgi:glycosyltransferase involved in cell wall biosynthesis